MGRNRTVSASVDRIDISDGDWIEVKRDLNVGDQKRLEAAGLKPPMVLDGKIVSPIDWAVYEMERAMIFLTDWLIFGPDDRPLKLNYDSLKSLDPDSFNEINQAILKHTLDRAVAKKASREAQAKAQSEQPKTSTESPASPESVPTST